MTYTKRQQLVGLNRLLKLATILDTADAEHRKKSEPLYNQTIYVHPCGTPACALGMWAFANPGRWVLVGGHSPRLKEMLLTPIVSAETEFRISILDAELLFEIDGCNKASTAKQAAKYIRVFVKRKMEELK